VTKFIVGDKVRVIANFNEPEAYVIEVAKAPGVLLPYKVEEVQSGVWYWCAENELELLHGVLPPGKPHVPPPTPQPLFTLPTKGNYQASGAITFFDKDYDSHVRGYWSTTSNEEQRKKWKEEGRCEECGTLRPMSIWGLGECPNHPAPPPAKQ
jgi:hypothetical protein